MDWCYAVLTFYPLKEKLVFLTSGSAAIHKFLLPTNDDDGDDKEGQVIIYNDMLMILILK